jgi:L-lactate dehydrogenase
LRDENAVLTVSSLAPESMNLGEVSLSLPTIIGRDGVAHVVSIPLSTSEKQAARAVEVAASNLCAASLYRLQQARSN